MAAVSTKRRMIHEWQTALAWHLKMVKLSLRALEHRSKNESLLAKLCIINMRKVIKQEQKWLKRAKLQLRQLKS